MYRIICRLVSDAPYYTLSAAKKYLAAQDISYAKKTHLIAFLSEINQSKLFDKERIKRKFSNAKKRFKQLKSLQINPATIEVRAGISYLPSLNQLISMEFTLSQLNPLFKFHPNNSIRAAKILLLPSRIPAYSQLRRNFIMNDSHCKSYFKSGEDCTTVQNYTNIWIQLINQLERSKMILSGAR